MKLCVLSSTKAIFNLIFRKPEEIHMIRLKKVCFEFASTKVKEYVNMVVFSIVLSFRDHQVLRGTPVFSTFSAFSVGN
jgi:hypothetical protein